MKTKDAVRFVAALLLPLAVGGIAGMATAAEAGSEWYKTLAKPPLQPPNWLFGPVWTVLYLLMGISLFFIMRAPASRLKTRALIVFGIQLILNFSWTFLFFKFHLIQAAAIEILFLLLCIIGMVVCMHKVNRAAAFLQLPYLAWVSFASYLSVSIAILN